MVEVCACLRHIADCCVANSADTAVLAQADQGPEVARVRPAARSPVAQKLRAAPLQVMRGCQGVPCSSLRSQESVRAPSSSAAGAGIAAFLTCLSCRDSLLCCQPAQTPAYH